MIILGMRAGDNSWTSVGPIGGSVTSVVQLPGPIWFAGTWGGVYRSSDSGVTWTVVNTGLTSSTVTSMVSDGINLFVGTLGGGIFKSSSLLTTLTWTSFNTGLTNLNIIALALDNAKLYAGTDSSGVFYCGNIATPLSWQAINEGLTGNSLFIRNLFIDTVPTNHVLYVGTEAGGVLSRTASGGSWSVVGGTAPLTSISELNVNAVAVHTDSGATPGTYIYAGTDAGGVYCFSSIASAWAEVVSGSGAPLSSATTADISSLAVYANTTPDPDSIFLYAGTDKKGIYRFIPGSGWALTTSPPRTYVRSLVLSSNAAGGAPTTISGWAGTWRGPYWANTNGGSSWIETNGNGTGGVISSARVRSIAYLTTSPAINGTLFIGTFGNGVFKQSPASTSWTLTDTASLLDLTINTVAVDPRTNTVFAGTGSEGVFRSDNSGSSWVESGLAGKDIRQLVIDPSNSSILYAGTWQGVYKTTNGGATWSLSGSAVAGNLIQTLLINPVNVSTLFAGTNAGLYKTTNGGTSWGTVNAGLSNSNIQSLAMDLQNPNILYAGTLGGGAFKTTNGGTSWTTINYNLNNNKVLSLAVDPLNTAVVYAGTDGGRVYKTMDGGANWTLFAPQLSNLTLPVISSVCALTIIRQVDQLTLYAGTEGNGVYEIRLPSQAENRPTQIVSTDSSGIQGNGMSFHGRISVASGNDGRYIAFQSAAGNLVTGDSNGYTDIFVKDRVTDRTVRISLAANGSQTNGDSYTPSISQDGRYIAFVSQATNLVSGDTNGVADIFVHDRDVDGNGTYDELGMTFTNRVSINSNGNQADNYSLTPSISNNGRYIVFASYAANLTTSASSAFRAVTTSSQIFLHDRLGTDTDGKMDVPGHYQTRLVSQTSASGNVTPANHNSSFPVISGNGVFVAYQTRATNLNLSTPGGTRTGLRIVAAGPIHPAITTPEYPALVSYAVADYEAAGPPVVYPNYGDDSGYNFAPLSVSSLFHNGTNFVYRVVFYSAVSPLTGMTPTTAGSASGQVYFVDLKAAAPVSIHSGWKIASIADGIPSDITAGGNGTSGTYGISVSEDGQRIAFTSNATDLSGTQDTNAKMDIYVRYIQTDGTGTVVTRHSLASDGAQANEKSEFPALTANGHFLAFQSWANNLVPGDGNNTVDVFVARVVTTTTIAPTSSSTTSSTLAHPAGTGLRTLTGCYTPGYSTPVSLKITPNIVIQVYTIEETVPSGWTVPAGTINENGSFDAGTAKVRWGPFYDNKQRTLRYTTTSLSTSMGAQIFSGMVAFVGYNDSTLNLPVAGHTVVYDNCSLHPADINKDMRLDAGEITTYAFAWITGQTWVTPPNPIPMNYVARGGYLWRTGEIYSYDSTNPAPDCWIPYSSLTANSAASIQARYNSYFSPFSP